MIHEPPVDELVKKTGSRYALCIVAAKRARQLIDDAQNRGLTEIPGPNKPISAAAYEILEGRVSVAKY
ncbi:MAG: DNA-directed RNA polymerase subunit omega [Clostridia bacterium]|nr:DNA-directed RNA polymerase subunit omega [Clostridia bacterium]